ncbi:MAG: ribosome silencing factor [Deltaproteobacteria bacterium]|jgi:ribosome-associated protein|nr:ribosome silencing factor [Deltaproteobacteria bacterium]
MIALKTAKTAVKALENKRGKNIQLYEVGSFLGFTDYIIIVSGSSSPQLKALADEVEKELFEAGEDIIGVEGKGGSNWILVDTGTIVVHIFTEEAREYYELDSLYQNSEAFEKSNLE